MGAVCGAVGVYTILVGPAQSEIGRLADQLRSAEESNRLLAESATRRQATIDEARRILNTSTNILADIRKIVKLLQEAQ
jgi:hypothetical protein